MPNPEVDDREDDDHEDDDTQQDLRGNVREHISHLRSNIEFLKATTEQKLELAQLSAKLTFGRYEALMNAGFSAAEALALIIQNWSE